MKPASAPGEQFASRISPHHQSHFIRLHASSFVHARAPPAEHRLHLGQQRRHRGLERADAGVYAEFNGFEVGFRSLATGVHDGDVCILAVLVAVTMMITVT